MGRFPFLLGAAFLSGALAGALAMGSLGSSLGSGTPSIPGRPANSGEAVPITEPVDAPAAGDTSDGAALTAVSSEILAVGSEAEAEGPDWEARLRLLAAGWARTQEELTRLQGRVSGLERRLAANGLVSEPERPATADDRRSLLVTSGVGEDRAADIVWREGQYELDRLELRDTAIREGWFGDERYREEVGRLEREKPDLRAEVGDDAYDRYLFSAGEDNRVRVSAAIPGSPAEAAGLGPGDLIETYDGGRVFTFSGLRNATADGERGELVPMDVRRPDGSRIQVWLPRGPLGVRLDLTRVDPDA